LSFSHPRFGSLLASCGFDKKVCIWRDTGKGSWEKLFEYSEHKNSVNCLAFAPQEYGLVLLCGSSDGYISIHEYRNDTWNSFKIFGHGFGVNAVSWGPALYHDGENNTSLLSFAPMRFVSCGNDNLIRVWQAKENRIDSFYVVTTLEAHEDVVRDIAWRNVKNSNYDVIVSGGDVNIENLNLKNLYNF
jgi:protein transport protein SEC13